MAADLDLVTAISSQLMDVTADGVGVACERALREVVEHSDIDVAFLRHNDHAAKMSTVVAEWPPRPYRPDPDPLGVAPFDSHNPVFAVCASLTHPTVVPATLSYYGYLPPDQEADLLDAPSVAVAPLLSGGVTAGLLGFGKFCGDTWSAAEISTLQAIASLLAQLQARITAENKLRYLADHDDMTGLWNRRALIGVLEARLRDDAAGPVAVLYIDLDRLKAINDIHGHSVGDAFIAAFADHLRRGADEHTVVARLGGDEFVVVPQRPMSTGAAMAYADGLLAGLRQQISLDGHTMTRTVSIGVATGEPGRDDSASVLRRADDAVLAAKRAGGNRVVAADDASLRHALRSAVHNDESRDDTNSLMLHYLPEIDLQTCAIVATEALVRWQHPTRGLLGPASFLEVADAMNLADNLGRWVLRTACADLCAWQSQGLADTALLRVNVSPRQLADDTFVDAVADVLAEFDIQADQLCVEITERAIAHDIDSTRQRLRQLKKLGLGIAVDDFGNGHAVLSHLQHIPVDTLKIDARFVRDLATSHSARAVTKAIIGIADAFELDVVGKGVETDDAAHALLDAGCQRAQGFLYSRPVPAHTMQTLLTSGLPTAFSGKRTQPLTPASTPDRP